MTRCNDKTLQDLEVERKSVIKDYRQRKIVSYVAVRKLRDLDEQIKAARRGRRITEYGRSK